MQVRGCIDAFGRVVKGGGIKVHYFRMRGFEPKNGVCSFACLQKHARSCNYLSEAGIYDAYGLCDETQAQHQLFGLYLFLSA